CPRPMLLLALGMSLAMGPLTTLVLTSVESDRAGTASGVNSAVSRAGSVFAIALLGGVLQQGGPQLFSGFHMAMAVAAIACVLATFAVFIIEPGPHVDFIPRDWPVRCPQSAAGGQRREETMKNEDQPLDTRRKLMKIRTIIAATCAALAFSMAGPIYAHDSEARTVTKKFEAAWQVADRRGSRLRARRRLSV